MSTDESAHSEPGRPRNPQNREIYAKLEMAREKHIKSGQSEGPECIGYSRALRALETYPLPLLSMGQALQLQGFGPKMAALANKVIENKYQDFKNLDPKILRIASPNTLQNFRRKSPSSVESCTEVKLSLAEKVQKKVQDLVKPAKEKKTSTLIPITAFLPQKKPVVCMNFPELLDQPKIALSTQLLSSLTTFQSFNPSLGITLVPAAQLSSILSLLSSVHPPAQVQEAFHSLVTQGRVAWVQQAGVRLYATGFGSAPTNGKRIPPESPLQRIQNQNQLPKGLFSSFTDSFDPKRVCDGLHGADEDRARESFKINRLNCFNPSIRLFLDKREKKSHHRCEDYTYFLDRLRDAGVECQTLNLPVGDFLWVLAYEVLDWIIERKQVNDFAASIGDGRYEDQKFRLKISAIKSVIYLIEGDVFDHRERNSMLTASSTTKLFNKFVLLKSTDTDASIRMITSMHRMIKDIWKQRIKQLQDGEEFELLCRYESFAKNLRKSDLLTNSSIFYQAMLQIKGCGKQTVLAITSRFKCFRELYDGFAKGSSTNSLIQNMKLDMKNEKVFDLLRKVFDKHYL